MSVVDDDKDDEECFGSDMTDKTRRMSMMMRESWTYMLPQVPVLGIVAMMSERWYFGEGRSFSKAK